MKENLLKKEANEFRKNIKLSLNDLKSMETWKKQIPNLLTSVRIVAAIPVAIVGITGNLLTGAIISLVAFCTDAFDGKIARKLHVESKFGADLDAISDKLLSIGTILPLVPINPVLCLTVALEATIASINTSSRLNGNKPKTIMIGKIKTWALGVSTILAYLCALFNLPMNIFASCLGITTTLQLVCVKKYNDIRIKENEKQETIDIVNSVNEEDNSKIKKQNEKTSEKIYSKNNNKQNNNIKSLRQLREEILNNQNNDINSEEEKGYSYTIGKKHI